MDGSILRLVLNTFDSAGHAGKHMYEFAALAERVVAHFLL